MCPYLSVFLFPRLVGQWYKRLSNEMQSMRACSAFELRAIPITVRSRGVVVEVPRYLEGKSSRFSVLTVQGQVNDHTLI